MRKIKDLVTVQLENALCSFVGGEERYELLASIRQIVKAVEANDENVPEVPLGRIRDFVEGTHRNFVHGAMALALAWQYDVDSDELNAVIAERAARTQASLGPSVIKVLCRETHVDCQVGAIVGRLWMEFYALLSSVQGPKPTSQ